MARTSRKIKRAAYIAASLAVMGVCVWFSAWNTPQNQTERAVYTELVSFGDRTTTTGANIIAKTGLDEWTATPEAKALGEARINNQRSMFGRARTLALLGCESGDGIEVSGRLATMCKMYADFDAATTQEYAISFGAIYFARECRVRQPQIYDGKPSTNTVDLSEMADPSGIEAAKAAMASLDALADDPANCPPVGGFKGTYVQPSSKIIDLDAVREPWWHL